MTDDQSGDLRRRDPAAFLRRETAVRPGRVGDEIGGIRLEPGKCELVGEEFLLCAETVRLHYRKGEGVTIDRLGGSAPGEEELFLNGSVYAAAACINGFYPLHASAVAHGGRVFAFTGPSGAGKSTLTAALGGAGLPMFCDDTLVLDLSDPAVPMALPGHKRLKLTPEALALTGAVARERVHEDIDKHYAEPPGGDWQTALPLTHLAFLEDGPACALEPITGAERMTRLEDDHYTADYHRRATRLDPAGWFRLRARLAGQIAMVRLVRPRDLDRFAESVALARQWIVAQDWPA
jgi:hypothetical protein